MIFWTNIQLDTKFWSLNQFKTETRNGKRIFIQIHTMGQMLAKAQAWLGRPTGHMAQRDQCAVQSTLWRSVRTHSAASNGHKVHGVRCTKRWRGLTWCDRHTGQAAPPDNSQERRGDETRQSSLTHNGVPVDERDAVVDGGSGQAPAHQGKMRKATQHQKEDGGDSALLLTKTRLKWWHNDGTGGSPSVERWSDGSGELRQARAVLLELLKKREKRRCESSPAVAKRGWNGSA
jgi:hypothetical protein